jgi:hypothetical protein
MADIYTRLDTVAEVAPYSEDCDDCLRIGGRWMHLRMYMRSTHSPLAVVGGAAPGHDDMLHDFAPGPDLNLVVVPDVLLWTLPRLWLLRRDDRNPDEG